MKAISVVSLIAADDATGVAGGDGVNGKVVAAEFAAF
jgi:hypothetical protein